MTNLSRVSSEHSIDASTRFGKHTHGENKNQMKIFCLRWNRCRIHLDDKELAFSQLQRENLARRWGLCP